MNNEEAEIIVLVTDNLKIDLKLKMLGTVIKTAHIRIQINSMNPNKISKIDSTIR